MTDAVIFDMDGVLIDSEAVWAEVRHQFTLAHGGRWPEGTDRKMMGMSSPEWAAFMRTELAVDMDPDQISAAVVDAVALAHVVISNLDELTPDVIEGL